MNHLSAEQLVDAVEGTLAPVARTHFESCPACREEVAQLAAVLVETAGVAIPEPSPLFWSHFSTRVRDAIVAEPKVKVWLPRWFEWRVLAPIAGLALLVLALISAVDRSLSVQPARNLAATAAPPTVVQHDTLAIETAWDVLSDLVGPLDVDAAQEAGIATALGTADLVVLQLTQSEQEELVQLLQQEVGRVGS